MISTLVSMALSSRALVRSAAATPLINVDWGSIGEVLVVTLIAAVVIVVAYSTGLRLLAIEHRPVIASVGAYVCIAVGIAAVLYGIYLVIPAFHSS